MGLADTFSAERRKTLMKGLSVAAGFFLVVAGILGCTSLVLGGGIIYFIGALYAIAFGLVVIVVEFKDKTPIISIAYKLIDKYLKFLTIQRGKGLFYLGVGILVFFMGPTDDAAHGSDNPVSWASYFTGNWGVNNVAALVLAIVGGMHTCHVIRDDSARVHSGPALTASMAPSDGLDFSRPIEGMPVAGKSNFSRMVEQDAPQ